jgi:predicted DNA-binding transcriptional regulator AlpA
MATTNDTAAHAQDDRILWQSDIARYMGVDRTTVYRWELEGRLPQPDVVIGRRRGRRLSTIREFERSTLAAAAATPSAA